MTFRWWASCALRLGACLALGCINPVAAHLMPQAQGAVRVDGNTVYATVSLPVAELRGFDTNSDGRLSLLELNQHRTELLDQANRLLDFRSNGQAGERIFEDLLIPHLHTPGAPTAPDQVFTEQLISMRRLQWPTAIQTLSLRADVFKAAGSPQQLALQAVTISAADPNTAALAEAVILSSHYPEHFFFQGAMASFKRFVPLGMEHMLVGVDHLLFLLTVLVSTVGWRRMVGVVTAFTVAHSITLVLSTLGWLGVSPSLAEPLIAASIVLVALNNLRTDSLTNRGAKAWRHLGLVFTCGLIHGLGFATALAALGGVSSQRWPGLLGFNLGVELGQLVFAGALLVLWSAALRLGLAQHTLQRRVSMLSAAMGGVLLWQQLANSVQM